MSSAGTTSSSPVSAIAFRWLDILEKEFDKSYVGLDHQLAQVLNIREEDGEDRVGPHSAFDDYEVQRKLLSNMAQCFVQLVHKAQTIFQTNAKLDAEALHLRGELAESRSISMKMESEKRYLICALQASLLENHKIKASRRAAEVKAEATPSIYNHQDTTQKPPDNDSYGSNTSSTIEVLEDDEKICSAIQMRLASEIASIQRAFYAGSKDSQSNNSSSPASNVKGLEAKLGSLEAECNRSRRIRAELESELVGARLDAKYLDKELAGRIQQIQILLATNTSQENKQTVWSQIEAEMHLQRSKTISNMCYSKQRVKNAARNEIANEKEAKLSHVPNNISPGSESKNASQEDENGIPNSSRKPNGNDDSVNDARINDHGDSLRDSTTKENEFSRTSEHAPSAGLGKVKQVHLHKHDSDELGMAILGGIEHGLPIMISEVFPGSSVSRSQKISAGDVIISVNGDSFIDMSHEDAVRYLSSLRGSIRFELQNTIEADIEAVCDMESRYYDLYDVEDNSTVWSQGPNAGGPSDVTSPVQTIHLNNTSKSSNSHDNTRKASNTNSLSSQEKDDALTELPQVHSSPRKQIPDKGNEISSV